MFFPLVLNCLFLFELVVVSLVVVLLRERLGLGYWRSCSQTCDLFFVLGDNSSTVDYTSAVLTGYCWLLSIKLCPIRQTYVTYELRVTRYNSDFPIHCITVYSIPDNIVWSPVKRRLTTVRVSQFVCLPVFLLLRWSDRLFHLNERRAEKSTTSTSFRQSSEQQSIC
jgi:hypothetical protein